MVDTQPFFIVSSGRSGTHALAKALSLYENVDMHHEYCVDYIQPLAFEYYHRLINEGEAIETIQGTYGSAVALSEKPLWGDSSNKASWIIHPLLKVFPNAKFIWLVRDGRKVVSSYFNKLSEECYDDRSVNWMRLWIENSERYTQPPPEKKYWWPMPPHRLYCYNESPSQFRLICWHWNAINEFIDYNLSWVPEENTFVVKLEDLTNGDMGTLNDMLNFLGLSWNDEVYDILQVPDNVSTPQDFSLTSEQIIEFWKSCRPTMEIFDYKEDEEYSIDYHPEGWDK